MTADVETVVVGGGVIGLAAARALALGGHEVMLLERHGGVGTETSARSSEVIHAGLYYPPGSLRARLCVAGRDALYRFCTENGVPHRRLGKLLVATEDEDVPRLAAIADNAIRNGVDDLRRLTREEARTLEPEIACVAACLSPSTGIIDSHAYLQALEGHVAAHGGSVVLNTAVVGLAVEHGLFVIDTMSGAQAGRITARHLVLAGGLGASQLGRMLPARPGYSVPVTFPARGHYYALAGRAPFSHLVYPMPSGAWLGVHLTLDVSGRARFGPDIEWVDEIGYAFDEAGGGRLARFEAEIRRYWPGLPANALHPDSVGVRPKIYREGEPVADFAIHGPRQHGMPRLVALYGMESPGLTASLAVGDHVASLLAEERV